MSARVPRTSVPLLAVLILTFPVSALEPARDRDSDGDGLSDFHETHKHFTDPDKKDSDGDGIPDGDRGERREYAYTIRAVMKVHRPVNEDALTDDRQDGRVVNRTDDCLEIEFILYPFNRLVEIDEREPVHDPEG